MPVLEDFNMMVGAPVKARARAQRVPRPIAFDIDRANAWAIAVEAMPQLNYVLPDAVLKNPKQQVERKKKETLNDYLGLNLYGRFGIEVEVEGNKILPLEDGVWTTKRDGSLRGESGEFILFTPEDLTNSLKALQTLRNHFSKVGTKLNFSFRTSVHVHVNVLHMTKEQLTSFLYLSHLYENVLVHYSGESRIGNRFCLRTKDAEKKLDQLKKFITGAAYLAFNQDKSKYSAINLATIRNIGSVEFRSMRGTLERDVLTPWIRALNRMYEVAEKQSVTDIAIAYKSDPLKFSQFIFDADFEAFNYKNFLNEVEEAYNLLIEIPYLEIGK